MAPELADFIQDAGPMAAAIVLLCGVVIVLWRSVGRELARHMEAVANAFKSSAVSLEVSNREAASTAQTNLIISENLKATTALLECITEKIVKQQLSGNGR
jgi:uncharacterized protein